MSLVFDLVTPERLALSKDVHMVAVPGAEGDFGVLEGHVPLISTIRPGVVHVYEKEGSAPERLFVSGGFAEVTGTRCAVLADGDALNLAEITRADAQARLTTAREALEDASGDGEKARAQDNLIAAEALLSALS